MYQLAPARGRSLPLGAIFGCAFFLSGFSALLYQVAWQRMLGLFAGSDVRSVTIIVGSYLAGIGVGSLVGSMIADRLSTRQALRLFALCELGIAAFAFTSRWVFYDLLFLRLNSLAASPATLLGAAFISVLIPTTLMGLSLPLLSRALVRSLAEAPRLIGRLYAINTVGSAIGALVAGWYLVGSLGFERAAYVGGAINGLVGLIALLAPAPAADERRSVAGAAGRPRISAAVWGWCALAAASGFVAISLELVWFRLLSVLVESKAYTFAHMLAFVLIGYALGSWLGTRALPRVRSARRLFLALQAAAILYALASILLIYLGYDLLLTGLSNARLNLLSAELLARYWPNLLFGYLVLPSLLLLPPNILIGLNFPITQRAVQTDIAQLGQRVGLIQVAGIGGNTAGSLVTGLLLLDAVGTTGTLRVLGAIGVLFLGLLLVERRRDGRRAMAPAGVGAMALAAALAAFPATEQFWTQLHEGTPGRTLVAEDSTGVSVIRDDAERASIYANGVLEGWLPFSPMHQTLGLLPTMVHPRPERVLIIGIGSAGTPYAAGANPATRSITAVEIMGSQLPVLRAAAEGANGEPLQHLFADPRLQIVLGDGRSVLAQSQERYDLIQADAIHPWRSYSGMLYSREFFSQARARLTAGGIMAQWAPTGRTINTFMDVFPYGVNIGGTVLLGSDAPIALEAEQLLQRLADPAVLAYLRQGQIDPELLRSFLAEHEVTPWTPETERSADINTDLWPRDEYALNNN
jgi:predicted membrane-bound spermidine synthase